VGARRPTWVKAVWPLAPSSRTGSSEILARTGPSEKPAGCPRAGRTIETLKASAGRWRRRERGARMGASGALGASGGGGEARCRGRFTRRGGATAVPTHAFFHGIRRRGIRGRAVLSFVSLLSSTFVRLPFLYNLLGAHIIFGQAWTEGKGELATCSHCADSGQETDCTYPHHDLPRSHASSD